MPVCGEPQSSNRQQQPPSRENPSPRKPHPPAPNECSTREPRQDRATRIVFRARRRSPLLDRGRRVRPTDEIQRIVEEVLVVRQPPNRPRNVKQREDDKRRNNITPDIPSARERKSNDTPDSRAQDPPVIARVNRRKDKHRKQDQPPCDDRLTSCVNCGDALHCQQRRPDQDRKKKRLRHRRRRQIQQIGIQRIERRRSNRPARHQHQPCEPIKSRYARDVADQRRPCASQPVLPPLHLLHEWQHQQVRQWQPHSTKLNQSWIPRVQNAARDTQMRHRISVQQQVAARDTQISSATNASSNGGQRNRNNLFAFRRPHFVSLSSRAPVAAARRRQARGRSSGRSRRLTTPACSRCEISRNSLNRSSISSRRHILQPLRAEPFNRKRSHHAAIEHRRAENRRRQLRLRREISIEAAGKRVSRAGWIDHLSQRKRRCAERIARSSHSRRSGR